MIKFKKINFISCFNQTFTFEISNTIYHNQKEKLDKFKQYIL